MRRLLSLFVLAILLAALSPASADAQTSVLGIPCTTQSDGTQACIGNGASERVPSFDGVPLDVNVWLPPAPQHPPFPVIFYLHGFGEDKNSSGADLSLARQGYVIVAYSARGFGMSCGLPISRTVPACLKGYEHLADIRYEPRDTQYLAGLLADTGLVNGMRVGVSGTSYGAGQSLMLATLKNRIVTADYKLVPWRSPGGKPMQIAAAAPNWAWSDLAEMLVPNGRSLDYSTSNDYGPDDRPAEDLLRRPAHGSGRRGRLFRARRAPTSTPTLLDGSRTSPSAILTAPTTRT